MGEDGEAEETSADEVVEMNTAETLASFVRSPLWKNDAAVRIMLVLVARSETLSGCDFGGKGVVSLGPGECIVSRHDLAHVCLTTDHKARHALMLLEEHGWVTTRPTNQGTFVRLVERSGDYPLTYATTRERLY